MSLSLPAKRHTRRSRREKKRERERGKEKAHKESEEKKQTTHILPLLSASKPPPSPTPQDAPSALPCPLSFLPFPPCCCPASLQYALVQLLSLSATLASDPKRESGSYVDDAALVASSASSSSSPPPPPPTCAKLPSFTPDDAPRGGEPVLDPELGDAVAAGRPNEKDASGRGPGTGAGTDRNEIAKFAMLPRSRS